MKRSPSTTHRYLRQLAEPIPYPAALLTPRRSHGRGASSRSPLDAIPHVLDSISDLRAEDPAPRLHLASHAPHEEGTQAPHLQTPPAGLSTAHKLEADAESTSHIARSAVNASSRDKRASLAMRGADTATSHSNTAARKNTSSSEPLAPQAEARPKAEVHKQSIAATPSATARTAAATSVRDPSNRAARHQSDRGIRVHIGTVEVRSNPPVPQLKPPPAVDRNTRISSPRTAAEPLSRGLAWSHGLVQG